MARSITERKADVSAYASLLLPLIQIVFAHPDDLAGLDLRSVPCNVWFFSDRHVTKGEMLYVKSKPLKKAVIEACIEQPERCFKGQKGIEGVYG